MITKRVVEKIEVLNEADSQLFTFQKVNLGLLEFHSFESIGLDIFKTGYLSL